MALLRKNLSILFASHVAIVARPWQDGMVYNENKGNYELFTACYWSH